MVNSFAIIFVAGWLIVLGLALLWRIGSWNLSPAAVLTHDEGLRLGTTAPQLASHRGDSEYHLDFVGNTTLLVFGQEGCKPCLQLLDAAPKHPATRHARLVYVTNNEPTGAELDHAFPRWELYRFHHEDLARDMWRAPVSPYFYLIDADGVIVAKGLANAPEHLDRLLDITPSGIESLSSGPGSILQVLETL